MITRSLLFSLQRWPQMPPLRQHQTIHTSAGNRYAADLSRIAGIHGGHLPHRLNRLQPYEPRFTSHKADVRQPLSIGNLTLPSALLDKIKDTQDAAVNLTTLKKDASRLREFLSFCEGLGIRADDALPAREEVLLAWASTFAGRLAGKTVGAKLLAIRKEHERRGLIWYCTISFNSSVTRHTPLSN